MSDDFTSLTRYECLIDSATIFETSWTYKKLLFSGTNKLEFSSWLKMLRSLGCVICIKYNSEVSNKPPIPDVVLIQLNTRQRSPVISLEWLIWGYLVVDLQVGLVTALVSTLCIADFWHFQSTLRSLARWLLLHASVATLWSAPKCLIQCLLCLLCPALRSMAFKTQVHHGLQILDIIFSQFNSTSPGSNTRIWDLDYMAWRFVQFFDIHVGSFLYHWRYEILNPYEKRMDQYLLGRYSFVRIEVQHRLNKVNEILRDARYKIIQRDFDSLWKMVAWFFNLL